MSESDGNSSQCGSPLPVEGFDAFLSYSSADRKVARHIQDFLQRFRSRKTGRYVRVYRDETDIRGHNRPAISQRESTEYGDHFPNPVLF
jgi:hypothetical protein